jgi:hypothetical protein
MLFIAFNTKAGDNMLLSLYPVPLKTNTLFVSFTQKTDIEIVELRNLIGRKIQSRISRGATQVSFENMSDLPNGIYMVLAKDAFGKIVETQKFIINK